MTHIIPVGTSEPQDFGLISDGEVIPGTGVAIELQMWTYANGVATAVVTPPTAAWLSAAAGTVRVTGVEDLAVGTYLARFKLTADSDGAIGYVPNQFKSDVWQVVPIANR